MGGFLLEKIMYEYQAERSITPYQVQAAGGIALRTRDYPNYSCDENSNYESCLKTTNLTGILEGTSEHLYLPASRLYGTQEKEEYRRNSESRFMDIMRRLKPLERIRFLEENPVVVCALFTPLGTYLPLLDGHHRSRFAGRFCINEIPACVTTPENFVDIVNRLGLYKSSPLNPISVTEKLRLNMNSALASFTKTMPERKKPIPVPAYSMDDLKGMFRNF